MVVTYNFSSIYFLFFFYSLQKIRNWFIKIFDGFCETLWPSKNKFHKNNFKVFTKFKNIAGYEEVKKELKEVVYFLKNFKLFLKLNASVPKGILLSGPPGTGKTLLAKAIAGESGVSFLNVSGTQFIEIFVGIGASRIRELFEKAQLLKPIIIFIDEIDSLASTRYIESRNNDQEHTLNQILMQMDGFKINTGILVIAATNRIDTLDPAIMRPGRFDRQILIKNPNLKERQSILNLYAYKKKFDKSVSLAQIAHRTAGFSGADLENILNEAAILATRKKKKYFTIDEINLSINQVIKNLVGENLIKIKSQQLIAFCKVSSAFISSLIYKNRGIEKLILFSEQSAILQTSINKHNSRQLFINQILILIAKKATEDMLDGEGELTDNSEQDMKKITKIIRILVSRYAMIALQEFKQQIQKRNLFLLGSDIKHELNNILDNFMTNLIYIIYNEVLLVVNIIRPGGERLVDSLLNFEELIDKDFRNILYEYILNINKRNLVSKSYKSYLFYFILIKFTQAIKDINKSKNKYNTPKGIRIPVTSVKGKCPRPLDDGGKF